MEGTAAGRQNRPVDIADIGAADGLDELTHGPGAADIFRPEFVEVGTGQRQGDDPLRRFGAPKRLAWIAQATQSRTSPVV